MIKVTVEYLVDEKELEKELEIIRRAYTEALKNKKMTDVEIIQNIKLQHYKQRRSRRNENCLLIFLKGIKL